MAGLHRSFMGDRTKDSHAEGGEHTPTKTQSPRSLDQGSHAHILKGMTKEHKDAPLSVLTAATSLSSSSKSHDALHSDGSSAHKHSPNSAESEVRSTLTTTLPKFHKGRFTVAPSTSDSIAVSHTAAEDAQDPTKDDDSYRTIPVRHRDYGHTEGAAADEKEDNKQERVFAMKGSHNTDNSHDSHLDNLLDPHAELRDIDVSLETVADVSERSERSHLHINPKDEHALDVSLETVADVSERSERNHLHINPKDEHALEEAEVKAPHGEKEEHKLVDMAFRSKLMDKSTKVEHSKKDDAEVDDEWDSAPADDYSRRDTVAGM
jgi:hypothetical protein